MDSRTFQHAHQLFRLCRYLGIIYNETFKIVTTRTIIP